MAIEVARLYAVLGADTSPAERALRGFTGFVRNTFSTALGFVLGQLFVGGIQGLVAEATQAIASFERMQMSLEALVAKEIKASGAVDSMAEALAQAGPRAEELYQWVQKLAIESPFGAEDVMAAMRTALAYGFTTKEAQKLTEVMLDFAAATGASGHVMNSIALALGQIRAKGKLAGQEILQLVNAGIDVQGILAQMGYTLDDVSKGLVSADEFMAAFVKTMEEDFGGAAKRQAETFTGLLNSLDDLKKLGLRAFFSGLYEAMKPLISSFVEWLQGPGLERLQAWGDALGRFASRAIDRLQRAMTPIRRFLALVGAFLRADIGRLSGIFEALGVPDWVAERIFRLSIGLQRINERLTNLLLGPIDWGSIFAQFPGMEELQGIGQSVRTWLETFGPDLAAKARAAFQGMMQAAQEALAAIRARVGPWVEETFGRFRQWLIQYGPILARAAQTVMSWIGKAFEFLAAQIGPILDFVLPILSAFLEAFLGFVGALAQIITGDWQGAWFTLRRTVENILDELETAVKEFWDWIVSLFKDMIPVLKELGENIIQGLWEGMKRIWKELVGWVSEKFNFLQNLMGQEWETESPSRVTMRLGENIMEGLRLGMERAFQRTDWQRYFRPASIPVTMPAARPWPPQLQSVKQEVTLVLQGQMGPISPEDVLLALRQAQMMGLLQ